MSKLKNKSLIVFTGGGLAPALNATLYGVIKAAKKEKMKVFGGMQGWASLLGQAKIVDLSKINIEPIKSRGGTFLRSSRTNPLTTKAGPKKIKKNLNKYNIDYVIAIGGDDTLGASEKLFRTAKLNVVGIPKTIDNDLSGTYWTPGFPTAAYKLARFVKDIKIDAAYSLSRIFVIETFGMKAGWLTAASCYGQADVIIPPEKKNSLKNTIKIIKNRYQKNGNYAVVVVSQEACFDRGICALPAADRQDQYSHKRQHFICLSLCQTIKDNLGITTVPLYPGNLLQSANPIEVDRIFAHKLGQKAIELIKEKKFGFMARLQKSKTKIVTSQIPLSQAVGKYNALNDSLFDFKNLKVKKKFLNYLEPILGKYKVEKNSYINLISKINK